MTQPVAMQEKQKTGNKICYQPLIHKVFKSHSTCTKVKIVNRLNMWTEKETQFKFKHSIRRKNQFTPFTLYIFLVFVINFEIITFCFAASTQLSTQRARRSSQIYFPDDSLVHSADIHPDSDGQHHCASNTTLYHHKTQKCYQVGSLGPCKNNLRFFPSRMNKGYGDCDCTVSSNKRHYVPVIYHPETEKCYSIYQQAYCRRYQWLIFSSPTSLQCVQNSCFKSSMKRPVVLRGKCVELGSSCSNTTNQNADMSNYTVGFKLYDIAARCDLFQSSSGETSSSDEEIGLRTLTVTSSLGCGQGHILNAQGGCQEIISFE